MRVIYADLTIMINLAVDYALLLLTARVSGAVIVRRRLLLGAAVGTAYALTAELWGHSCLWLSAATEGLMLLIAFGNERGYIKKLVIFTCIASALAGVGLLAANISGAALTGVFTHSAGAKILIPALVLGYTAMTVVFRGRAGAHTQTVRAEIGLNGRSVTVAVLPDTGCTLRDAVSNRPVLVAEAEALLDILPTEAAEVLHGEWDAVGLIERLAETECAGMFRLIPYNAVGTASGLLAAFRPDSLRIDGKNRDGMLVALTALRLSDGEYRALMGV